MNFPKVLILIFLFIMTLVITNMPNFHLDGYLGLHTSPLLDMAYHGSYYFVITFPIFLLLHNRSIPVSFLYFLLLLPALFEFSQALIPGRSVATHDLLANYLGIAPALSICFLLRYFFRGMKSRRNQA